MNPPTSVVLVEHAGINEALAAAQGEFPPIGRSHTAKIAGKDGRPGYQYSYADLGDVLSAVRPVLAKHGIALVQRTAHLQNGGVRLFTDLHHSSGQTIGSEIDLGQGPNNPQAHGGALTYLRRYQIVTLLGIAAEEDRDAQDVPATAPPAQMPAWARPAADLDVVRLGRALGYLLDGDSDEAERLVEAFKQDGAVPWIAFRALGLTAAAVKAAREGAAGAQEPTEPVSATDEPSSTPPEASDGPDIAGWPDLSLHELIGNPDASDDLRQRAADELERRHPQADTPTPTLLDDDDNPDLHTL
jgi:hypothetical protein